MSLFRPAFLVAILLSSRALVLADAVLEGHVELPKSKSAPVMNKRYEIVSKGGVLSTNPPLAIVFLEGNFARPASLPVRQVVQKDFAFVPALLAVQKGTKVEFPNQDDAYHNVFSFSASKRFDLGRYRPDEKPVPSQVFDTAGLITLRCDIHEHMRGLILVLDTPHFVITDAAGTFRLKGVPSGEFKLKAWINSRTTREQKVSIKDGATLRVDFP